MSKVLENWLKIKKSLETLAPEILKDMDEGADDFLFEALKNKIKADLPNDFVEFYKLHNGQNFEFAGGFIDCEQLLPINAIIDEWNIWKKLYDDKVFVDNKSQPDAGIKDNWWNPFWIPITSDGSGNNFCIDLAPAEGGKFGQIIRMWHDDPQRELIANSLSEWFEKLANAFENGEYKYSEDDFGMIKTND